MPAPISLPRTRSPVSIRKRVVAAPRDQVSQAYGDTVRARVDPALVEWAGAGVFNARVFPRAAGQLHRIAVSYDVDLVRIDGSLDYKLDLPEQVPAAVVDISIAKPGGATATVTPAPAPRAKPVAA